MNFNQIFEKIQCEDKSRGYSFYFDIVKRWCEKNKKMLIERVVIPELNQFYIYDSIKTVYPNYIEKTYYKFPIGNYYYITDKGKRFTIRRKMRPYTFQEKQKISKKKQKIRNLYHYEYLIKNDSSLSDVEKNYKSKKLIEQIDSIKDELKQYVTDIESDRKAKCKFIISLCKDYKYIKIFMEKSYEKLFMNNGYKVFNVNHSINPNQVFDQESLNWVSQSQDKNFIYVQMTNENFESCCKHGWIPKFGMIIKNGKQVKYSRGQKSQEVSLQDSCGNILKFDSMNDIAKKFNVSKGCISKKLKDKIVGDVITINGELFSILNKL